MDNNKVYTPQVIEENPFPQSGVQPMSEEATQSSANGVYSPAEIAGENFPAPIFSTELISQALDTKSRKILQSFEFTKSGALQVGEYSNGVSGDIKISPSGIVARNISGVNTFTLDGDTGDGTFQGTVRASTFESNNLLTGLVDVGTGSGNSYVRLDGANNRIVIHDGTNPRIVIGNI